jgi:cysteine-rich repeat protein
MSKLLRFCACVVLGVAVVACGDNSNPNPNVPGDAMDPPEPVCGDGRIDPGEECDDGNNTDGDGCDTNCTVTACGNGIQTANEGCDDGNTVDGDGCDSNCMVTGCGNGIVSAGEECDDGNDVSGDGCDNNCKLTACGNGVVTDGEVCDDGNDVDGDGCDSNCTKSGCGNGVVSEGEECDDGNTDLGDGCSATCETEILEIEPNEDGTPSTGTSSTGGNDFASENADANGAFTGSVTIYGSISPVGDEDVFAFTNPGPTPVSARFDVWNMAPGFGVGTPCGTSSIDTALNLRTATGALLASNDDRSSSDWCSGLTYTLNVGETVYAHVIERGDDAEIARYALVAIYTAPVCGDSIIGPGEQCDDGNVDDGDGCSSTCQLEGVVNEVEPNEDGTPSTGGTGIGGNDFASANADANGAFQDSVTIAASLSPAGDEDVFAFTNPGSTYVVLSLDVWNLATGYGIGTPCGGSIDTGMHIRNATGTSLASNDDRNGTSDRCSALSYAIPPGETVYAHVVAYGDATVIPLYALEAVYTPVVCGDGAIGPGEECDDGGTTDGDGCSATCQREFSCGDGTVDAGEQCDDGGTTDGDGCSATCQIEGLVTEVEPNEDGSISTGASSHNGNDFASANADANGAFDGSVIILGALSPAGDEDVFAFTNPGTSWVEIRFDTWNLAPGYGLGVSCGSAIDTGINIRSATGTLLASNGDRRLSTPVDYCAGLTYALAPGETVYAHIVEYGDNHEIPSYLLQVVYTPVVCGDGTTGPGEECDDGGTTDGDGCSATCQIEYICGDGVLDPGEQCDDGGTTDGDGCSATCQLEGLVTEVEPNEDGSISTGASGHNGNDFASANADANGAFTDSVLIGASLSPAGDEDVFAFANPGTSWVNVRFDTWNLAPGYGLGVSCGTSIDTGINIRDASGTLLAANGDRSSTPSDYCAGLSYAIAPGETVYVHVVEFGDNNVVPSYVLEAVYTPIVCGDGVIEGIEQCDDGGTSDGDGCSATCLLEGVAELEPNDDGTVDTGASGITGNDFDATAAQGPFSGDTLILASLAPAGDEDVFAFTNPTALPVFVRFDTWNLAPGYTVGTACGSSIDLGLHIRDAMGTSLMSNNDRNGSSDRCAGLTYFLAPGATVYAHVVENGDNAIVDEYALEVTYLPTDFESEPNDDGSIDTGASGITGNDFSSANANGPYSTSTLIAAALSPIGDEDVYAITNPTAAPVSVRVDFWNLAPGYGVGVACGSSVDAGLHIRNAAGTSLASNDDRNSTTDWCPGLSYTIPAGTTVYAHVMERGDNAEIPSYALEIRFPTP